MSSYSIIVHVILTLASLKVSRDAEFISQIKEGSNLVLLCEFQAECQTTEYSPWSTCSVTCGKGLRMRTRSYRMPEKASMLNCNRQLVSKEMCVASIPECS